MVTVTVEVEEEEGEEEEVEGAVGGMVEEAPQLPSPFLPLHAANQARRTKVCYILKLLNTKSN